jgi:predicted TIM-barrel fold metal-dependent hydrolase
LTLDFACFPVIDNHCHPLDPQKAQLDTELLVREFYHGFGDLPKRGVMPRRWGVSESLSRHLPYLGIVQTLIHQLSKVLDCSADIDAVVNARNRQTQQSLPEYVQWLYKDARIVGTVLDSDLPVDDPILNIFPVKLMRLFQMSPALSSLLRSSSSFQELLASFQIRLDSAIRYQDFVGVKAHLAEEVGFGVRPKPITNSLFDAARSGDRSSYQQLYLAVFIETLRQCQKLGVPVHLHTGLTGGLWDGPVSDADPFQIVSLLQQPEFIQTRIVLLHGAYPWIQHAAAVAHALPHVWVDLSWTTPWIAQRIVECYRDAIGMMPLSKLMIGSGGHGIPEIAWLSAKTAKIALKEVLEDNVRRNLLGFEQAEQIGRMILHDNAARLYGLLK